MPIKPNGEERLNVIYYQGQLTVPGFKPRDIPL